MAENNTPEMSVILFTPGGYETIQETIEHLRRQTARERLEIVIVTPCAREFNLDHAIISEFATVRLMPIDPRESVPQARAAGIFASRAPIVVLGENHSYPAPDWAEALIRAHQDSWAAVGPAMNNAIPDSLVGWAMHFITYGQWCDPVPAGVVEDLPGHNSSYKRDLLVRYESQLAAMLEVETLLHWDLKNQGCKLYLEPQAKTNHISSTQLSIGVQELYQYGRLFGAMRARRWSLLKRLAFAGGAALIPWVRLRRILRDVQRNPRRDFLPRILPAMIAGLIASAAGELVGDLFGAGDSSRKMNRFEVGMRVRR